MTGPAGKLLHLESVRGLAAVAVVVSHVLFALALPGADGTPTVSGWASPVGRTAARWALHPAGDGRLPVAVFFVLSGVVLSQGFLRHGGTDLAAACVRRFVRLAGPAGAATLLAWAVWRFAAGAVGPAIEVVEADGGSARWLRGLLPADRSLSAAVTEAAWGLYFQHPAPPPHKLLNCVLWTMRVELCGSLLVYAFLAVAGRHPRAGRLAAGSAVVAAVGGWVYPALFLAGVSLAIARHARPAAAVPGWVGVLVAGAALWVDGLGEYHSEWGFRVPLARKWVDSLDLFGSVGGVLLVGAVLFTRPLATVLAVRPLVWLGGVSFGLYLVHVPVLLGVGCGLFVRLRPGLGHGPAVVAVGAAVLGLSLAGGWLLTVAVDRPATALGRRLAGWLLGRPVGA